jgi:NAD(P)-dependent dehydrogenase (short-subunit alcohol dehydrogenase family)
MSTEPEPYAVVVGGGSGIGAALVRQYREHKTPVVVWDIGGERDVTCDIGQPEQIDLAVAETTGERGAPAWVTVTAGVGHSGLLTDTTVDDWDRVMQINARGPWLCMRSLAHAMRQSGTPGSMVATTSISAHVVDRNMGIYCASKAALSMLVKVAASEWGPHGIRVNAVAPGVTRTPMLGRTPAGSPWLSGVTERTPLGRLGEADDIAQAIQSLHALPWVTGQVLDCDGGLALQSPIDSYGEYLRARGRRTS